MPSRIELGNATNAQCARGNAATDTVAQPMLSGVGGVRAHSIERCSALILDAGMLVSLRR